MAKRLVPTATPEYLTLQKCYEMVIGVVGTDPGSLCDALFSKGYVSESVRNYTRNDALLDENKARKLIDTLIDRIKDDPNVFHGFVEVLKSSHYDKLKKKLTECFQAESNADKLQSQVIKSSQSDVSSSEVNLRAPAHTKSSESYTNNDTSFVCPYCKNCSLEQYLSDEGCPEAIGKTLFPYLNMEGLSEEDRTVLEDTLASAAKDLRTLFARTDNYVAQNLHADVTLVKNFALNLVRDLEQEENEAKIEKANTIPEVILALHPYKSFLSYEIIESIVDEFGSPDICAMMQKYVATFSTFCKRSAFELPNNVLPKKGVAREEKVLSVKLTNKGHASLRNVVSAREVMASVLGVKKWALRICSIESGCMCVRFLVSAAVISKIFPLSPNKINSLKDAGINIEEQLSNEVTNRSTRLANEG